MDILEHSLQSKVEPDCEEGQLDVQGAHAGIDLDQDAIELAQDVDPEDQSEAMAGSAITLDPTVQYQLRAEAGPVTYRVVQVTQNEDGQILAAGIPSGVTQVVTNPFAQEDSPSAENIGDARFTYIPQATAETSTQAVTDNVNAVAAANLGQVATTGGQFYVMMSPQDVLQAGQRTIAPRTGITPRIEGARTTRDERRRATHNEVERRRRDKINNWIVQLSKLVPDCAIDQTKQGQVSNTSKGGILAKACDHINELRSANIQMAESLKETERLSVDAELLRQQCEELKQENTILRATLQQHGIVVPEIVSSGS